MASGNPRNIFGDSRILRSLQNMADLNDEFSSLTHLQLVVSQYDELKSTLSGPEGDSNLQAPFFHLTSTITAGIRFPANSYVFNMDFRISMI